MKIRLKKALWLLAILLFCGFVGILSFARTRYIAHAYLLPGDGTSLRGYPTVAPPPHYTGTWTHYAYDGRVLAVEQFLDGHEDGRQVYLDDGGQPYVIRYIKDRHYDHDELVLPSPADAYLLRWYPRAWFGPS